MEHSAVRNILVIKLRAIGDVLLSTIVTKNLRLFFPQARIAYLTEPPSADVLKYNPFVNDVLIFDRKKMSGFDLIRMVRKEKFDLVLDLFGNPRTALVTRLSGASRRVGYRFSGRTYAYNTVVTPRGGEVHNTQFNLDALEAIDVAIQDRNIYFLAAPEDEQYVEAFLTAPNLRGRALLAVNTGGGWYTKRWGIEKFAALSDRLTERYGTLTVLTWGPGEHEETVRLQALLARGAYVPPPTTLLQLGVLLRRCSAMISNDSGPMHIAAAVGTPVLGIYGPTNPLLQGPFGPQHLVVRNEPLECLGCNLTACPIGHPCMKDLSVDSVIACFERLLAMNSITL